MNEASMARVAVTGASGFVGRAVVDALHAKGWEVLALGRERAAATDSGAFRRFDPNGAPDPGAFAGADAVIHLAGEPISGYWTREKRRRIAESRVAGTRTVVESLKRLPVSPTVLVSASAVGYYGDRGDEVLTESSARGEGFLAGVCANWEDAAREVEALGIRSVQVRTGIALGDGGALAQMRKPFQFLAGGPLGSGRQFVPWIHVRDLAALYLFAVEQPGVRGALNAVTPDYATNVRLARAIGAALSRPSLLPAPPLGLRLVLGEFAETLLGSQVVLPTVAEDAGFRWNYPQLESAIASILCGDPVDAPYVRRFAGRQFVPRPLEEVFEFFAEARNLQAITPASLGFAIRSAPLRVERGSIIEYTLRLRGIPMRWKTMIARYEPTRRFEDVQLRGPYRLWHHVHEFNAVEGGTELVDSVDYILPYGPLGRIAEPFVRREVEGIFRHRHEAIFRRFPARVN